MRRRLPRRPPWQPLTAAEAWVADRAAVAADWQAVGRDWTMVGNDLRRAIEAERERQAAGPITGSRVVSPPGSRLVVTEYELTTEARAALAIDADALRPARRTKGLGMFATSIKDLDTTNRIGAVLLVLMVLTVGAMAWHSCTHPQERQAVSE